MTAASLTSLISLITLAISGAKELTPAIIATKNFVSSLFSDKVITIEQQNAIHSYIDSLDALYKNGVTPSAWQVQPNP